MPAYLFRSGGAASRYQRGTGSSRGSGRRPAALRLSGWLSRNRRLAIALLLCVAAAVSVHQLTPAPVHTVTGLAAARDLAAGSALAPADLARVQVPPEMMAAGFLKQESELAGKQLAAPLRKGQ